MPAIPPSSTYAASSTPALVPTAVVAAALVTAAASSAISEVMTIAAPASSSTATIIPTAASGRAYGSHGRPAVSLSATTANRSRSDSSSRTLLRCQNSRRNRHVQVSSSPITSSDRTTNPTSRATSRPPSLRRKKPTASQATSSTRSPAAHDRLAALPALHHVLDRLRGATPGGLRELEGERGVGHDERADEGRAERRLGLGELAGEPVLDAVAGERELAVAELAALDRVEDARGLGPHGLPARRVERRAAWRDRRRPARRPARPGGAWRGPRRSRSRRTRRRSARPCARAPAPAARRRTRRGRS